MSVLSFVTLFLILLCGSSLCHGYIIIAMDDYGDEVGLSLSGGGGTAGWTLSNVQIPLPVYNVTVFINKIGASFFVTPSLGSASLLNSFYQSGTYDQTTSTMDYGNNPIISGNYVSSPDDPNQSVGRYIFQFSIPEGSTLNLQISYKSQDPQSNQQIVATVTNSH